MTDTEHIIQVHPTKLQIGDKFYGWVWSTTKPDFAQAIKWNLVAEKIEAAESKKLIFVTWSNGHMDEYHTDDSEVMWVERIPPTIEEDPLP